jgi:hypothetical protein
MAENVEVAIVGTELEEDVFWTVPLVQYFLYEIFAIIQSKADWPFVRFGPGITLNLQLHFHHYPADLMWRAKNRSACQVE